MATGLAIFEAKRSKKDKIQLKDIRDAETT
jgi:hypothetical protein